MHSSQWKNNNEIFQSIIMKTTGSMTTLLDAAAAVDQGVSEALGNVNVVRIPATSHDFAEGSFVYISGTDNYDGMHKLVAVATDTFDIVAKYTAETFAISDTATFVLFPGRNFRLVEVRLFISNGSGVATAVTTAESFTVDLDDGDGNAFDVNLRTEPMSGLSSNIWVLSENELRLFGDDDKIIFAFANTDANTVGIKVIYRLEG
jgi:hypothetical protein